MPEATDALAAYDPLEPSRDPAMRRYAVVDVFTDTPLEGNALAVFTDARGLSPQTMLRLAKADPRRVKGWGRLFQEVG